MQSSKIDYRRIIAALLIGEAISILIWVGEFMVNPTQSALRMIRLHPIAFVYQYGPAGLIVASVLYFLMSKTKRSLVLISSILFAIAVASWYAIQVPCISRIILPPVTMK